MPSEVGKEIITEWQAQRQLRLCLVAIILLTIGGLAAFMVRFNFELSTVKNYLLTGLGIMVIPIIGILFIRMLYRIIDIRDAKRALAEVEGSRSALSG